MSAPLAKPKNSDRRIGTRVNLTLPADVDAAVGHIADIVGTGKASVIRGWLESMLPQLIEMARAIEAVQAGSADGLDALSGVLRSSVKKAEQAEMRLVKARAMPRLKAVPRD